MLYPHHHRTCSKGIYAPRAGPVSRWPLAIKKLLDSAAPLITRTITRIKTITKSMKVTRTVLRPKQTIVGSFFVDVNGDGVFEPANGDYYLANTRIVLLGPIDQRLRSYPVLASAITNSTGGYSLKVGAMAPRSSYGIFRAADQSTPLATFNTTAGGMVDGGVNLPDVGVLEPSGIKSRTTLESASAAAGTSSWPNRRLARLRNTSIWPLRRSSRTRKRNQMLIL
jgi:hypothetical protein